MWNVGDHAVSDRSRTRLTELTMQVFGFNFGEESGGMRGFNFTERVRKVLSTAREEAMDLGHEYVGTEHILLGLTRDEGVASTVLANLDVDTNALRNRLLGIVRRGTKEPGVADLPYTSRAKKTLELAMTEAKRMHHAYVGTEHLLLGLLAEQKGIAAQVLTDFGCTLERARAETLATLGAAPEERIERADEEPRTRHATHGVFDYLSSTNRLSARAVAIASGANIDAVKRGSRAVRAEHLLHALLEHVDGSAAVVLQHLGADRTKLLSAFNAQRKPDVGGGGPETQLDDTELLTLLGLAETEREHSGAPYVATHHLMLAVMTNSEIGNALFAGTGITPERVRQEAARISG